MGNSKPSTVSSIGEMMTNRLTPWKPDHFCSDSGAAHPLVYIVGEASAEQLTTAMLTTQVLWAMVVRGRRGFPAFQQWNCSASEYHAKLLRGLNRGAS